MKVRALPIVECALIKKELVVRCIIRTPREIMKHELIGNVKNWPTSPIKYWLPFHFGARALFSLICIEPFVKRCMDSHSPRVGVNKRITMKTRVAEPIAK